MEPHGRPELRNTSPGFWTGNVPYSFNILPHVNSFGQRPAYEYGNHQSMGQEAFNSLPHMQHHAMLQRPSAPNCVHVNPNYRPNVFSEHHPLISNRPRNLHINPHWKGRPEPTLEKGDGFQGEGHSSHSVGKKKIFVNPKVVSKLNPNQPSHPVETRPSSSLQFDSLPSEHTPLNILSPGNAKKNQSAESKDRNNEIVEKPVKENCVAEPTFVILNSRKLVRKTNVAHHPKLSTLEGNKRSPAALKIAKQVVSKYKLVRNLPTVHNTLKTVKSVPTSQTRRSRRKIVSHGLPTNVNSKSVYKFIRQTEDVGPPVKMGKKFEQSTPSRSLSVLRENSYLARRSLKSRYRLVKTESSHQKGCTASVGNVKAKAVHSRYKLVRQSLKESKFSPRNSSMSSFSLYSSPMTTKLRSFGANKLSCGRKVSRFRIIQTSMNKSRAQAPISGSGRQFGLNHGKVDSFNPGLFKNISWQNGRIRPLSNSKMYQPAGRSNRNSGQKNVMGTLSSKKVLNRSLVNIGGVLYRSTRTSLTRTCTGKAKERILHIRGRKFVMDDKGKTIRPASSSDTGSCGSKAAMLFTRVDIGGVTFTRRKDNTLVRTNTHYARNLLSLAKMRSIAFLTDKLRKNNQPCLIYHRFGKCLSHIAGKCWRVHDPRNISICRKFLQGICDSDECLLSHDVGPEKMPTCRFFLEGCCVRDNCPYLHVKLSAKAAICRQFLHGYCDAGDKCKKRHVFLCPDFEKDGKCSKGKYCPYPHTIITKQKLKSKRSTAAKHPKNSNKLKENCEEGNDGSKTLSLKENEKIKRYYDESSPCNSLKKAKSDPKDMNSEMCHSDEGTDLEQDDIQRSSKIGILPAYIPL